MAKRPEQSIEDIGESLLSQQAGRLLSLQGRVASLVEARQ